MKKTEACGRGDGRGQLGGLHELRCEDGGRSKTILFFGVGLGVVVGSYPVWCSYRSEVVQGCACFG